jgi:hypothetical protein
MLTMAILAVIGAFIFGFVLCCMFPEPCNAPRFTRHMRRDSQALVGLKSSRLMFAPFICLRPLRRKVSTALEDAARKVGSRDAPGQKGITFLGTGGLKRDFQSLGRA